MRRPCCATRAWRTWNENSGCRYVALRMPRLPPRAAAGNLARSRCHGGAGRMKEGRMKAASRWQGLAAVGATVALALSAAALTPGAAGAASLHSCGNKNFYVTPQGSRPGSSFQSRTSPSRASAARRRSNSSNRCTWARPRATTARSPNSKFRRAKCPRSALAVARRSSSPARAAEPPDRSPGSWLGDRSLTGAGQTATIGRDGQPGPPDRARLDVPAPRGPLDGAHARRLGDGLRRNRADAAGARRSRRQPPASRPALPPAPRVRALRTGPPGLGR